MLAAYDAYLETIPRAEAPARGLLRRSRTWSAAAGFGIGSAGLPAYNLLVEGRSQALENDVVLSMKQGNVAAPSRVVDDERITRLLRAPRPPHRGLAARAAGARRPVARLVRAGRHGPGRPGDLALRGRPRLGRRQRARRDAAAARATWARRRRRSTACPTPAAPRTSSTSRPRRRSRRRRRSTRTSPQTWPSSARLRERPATTTACSSTPSATARSPGSRSRCQALDPAALGGDQHRLRAVAPRRACA